MRYAYITPRPDSSVARELREVITTGSQRASERLQAAEKVAAARRASQHTLKVVTRTLGSTDQLTWERMVYAVQTFRR